MRQLSLEERKEIELKMLVYIANLCEENNISYSLCGGTLIGTVRHGGFIPWDDDVDIFLTRDNYNKLIKLLEIQSEYELYTPGITENYLYGFSKLMDKRTVIYGEYDKAIGTPEMGIFIDIYPTDLLPDNPEEQIRHLKKINSLLHCAYAASDTMYCYGNTRLKHWIKKVVLYPKHIVCGKKGTGYWMRKTEAEAEKYKGTGMKFRGSVYSRYGIKEILPREVYENTVEAVFEGRKVKILRDYDTFLRAVYGEYMKLPPKEKQILPHDYVAYWRE